ncbi:MAG: hypothetical protein JW909_13430 [Planctomycetes bacterium]|nr:hypothetical protein [Planctomycetota bacterium]
MEWTEKTALRKSALWALVISIGASALLGIVALVSGDFGKIQIKILLSSLSISAGSICTLVCAFLLEKKKILVLSIPGMALGALGTILLITGIWTEMDEEVFWKTTAIVWFFAAATTHVSLLNLARLSQKYLWSLIAATAVFYLLAIVLTVMVLWEIDEEFMLRGIGVLGILAAALSILIPVFHRLSRPGSPAPGGSTPTIQPPPDGSIRMLCPVCGAEQTAPAGGVTCTACGSRFVITIVEDKTKT